MTKISELTVADLRGIPAQIADYLQGTLRFDKASWTIWHFSPSSWTIYVEAADDFTPEGKHGLCKAVDLRVSFNLDDDTAEVSDKLWASIAKIGSRERRELEHTMKVLGSALEDADKFTTEFAAVLRDRVTAVRDEAGARLIEHQPAE